MVQSVVVDCTVPRDPYAHTLAALQAAPKQLRDWNRSTLKRIRELASSTNAEEKLGGVTFFYRRGLIYRM